MWVEGSGGEIGMITNRQEKVIPPTDSFGSEESQRLR